MSAGTAAGAVIAPARTGSSGGGWTAGYRRGLVVTDVVIIVAVVLVSQTLRFNGNNRLAVTWTDDLSYWLISALLAGGWVVALALHSAWDPKSLGAGPTEFRRVTTATCAVISCTAIVSFLTRLSLARGYLAIALPLGLVGLLAGRWVWRMLLAEHRRAGSHLNSVLVIGGRVSAPALADRLRSRPEAGYRVAGLCVPGGVAGSTTPADTINAFPVVGGISDVLEAIKTSGADTVAVAASEIFGPDRIRRLAWELEGSSTQLILAPALTDVAGPRIHVEPVAGLPLMDVRSPTFGGPQLVAKVALDYLVAGITLLVLSPLLLVTAVAILATSGRPIFYRPRRIGRAGRSFRLVRFRSMTVDAARITMVGRLIRRVGIDQSTELVNVLLGQMSIVGTRPIHPAELQGLDAHLERRTRLRPGITGPAQVLGRSNLSVADQIQLDLYYLENWSIPRDVLIMARALAGLFHRRWSQPPSLPEG